MTKKEYLRNEIEHRGIYRCEPGTRLPAKARDKYYTWQFYLRRCMYDAAFTNAAADLLVELLPNKDVQVGACEDAGVVLGMAIAERLAQPMFSIKKTPKAYGLMNKLEGRLTGQPVLLVDDLAGSQATLRTSRQMLAMMNIPIANEYVTLINKTTASHATYLDNMQLISLFTCDDFKLTWADYETAYNTKPNFGLCY